MTTELRDSAVTEYLRTRVRQLKDSGLQGKEIAQQMGVSPAMISQLQKTHGVGNRSIAKFARGLRFASPQALRQAAYAWFSERATDTASLIDDPAVRQAVDYFVGLNQATEEQLIAILHAYAQNERWNGREATFWIGELARELERDRKLAVDLHAEMKADARDLRARKTETQGAVRAAHRRRKTAAAASEEGKNNATSHAVQSRRRASGGVR